MIDKRVIKTKTNIKNTLKKLILDKPYEKITVTEICNVAKTSRITFYTYYDDKNSVVEEIFDDYMKEATKDYYILEEKNNKEKSPIKGYYNVLDAILDLYYNNLEFFAYTNSFINPYLYSSFYSHTFTIATSYIEKHSNDFKPKYSTKLTAILICNSLWGVINEFHANNADEEEVRKSVRSIYADILNSDIFTIVK